MNIGIVSGKGGTGKTTLATGLAYVMKAEYIDMDAEEPNGRFFLSPLISDTQACNGMIPAITANCTFCGICADKCPFSALTVIKKTERFILHEDLCHHCGLCIEVCPERKAITEMEKQIGQVNTGRVPITGSGFMEGMLNTTEPSSVPLLEFMKAKINTDKINILDASPGASCPVVSVIDASDYIVLAGEPTPFGISDLKIVYELIQAMGKKAGLVINKYMGNNELNEFALKNNIPILGIIPFKREIAENYSRSINIAETMQSELEAIAGEIRVHTGDII